MVAVGRLHGRWRKFLCSCRTRNISLKQFTGEWDWNTTKRRIVHWIFVHYQEWRSITGTGECLEVVRALCLLPWWEEGAAHLDMFIHLCGLPSNRAQQPNQNSRTDQLPFSMQGSGGLQLSLTTVLDFSSPNLCCKVLSWAEKHSLESIQFRQQQQQPVLSALGRELARDQGCSALSSAPNCNVWSEFKGGQNAFASVNMSFFFFFFFL